MKSSDPMSTNGSAYFFSCSCSPGAMNAQTCQRIPGAAPGLKPLADRRGHVGLRLADGVAERLPSREPGGDGRRERAAGAVGVRGIQARRGEARELAAVPEDVGRRLFEVPALDEHV